jgi:hypothetical protein
MASDAILLHPVVFGFAVCVWVAFPRAAGIKRRENFYPHFHRPVCPGRGYRVDAAAFGLEADRQRDSGRRRRGGNGKRCYPAGRHFTGGSRVARAGDGVCVHAVGRVECFAGGTPAHWLLVCVDFFGCGGQHDDGVVPALLRGSEMDWIGLPVDSRAMVLFLWRKSGKINPVFAQCGALLSPGRHTPNRVEGFFHRRRQLAGCPYTPNTPTPDCNYLDGDGHRVISCERDLQDFARLWIAGVTTNLLAALPPGCTISLNWGDVGNPNPNNPTIDLFPAADSDGGIGYQTNEDIATGQIDNSYFPYIGRIGPGSNLVLNASTFANNWAGNFFIWCGVSNGTGGLNLTIANSNGTVLAQTTTYIQIEDIKQMYERWTVGDNPNLAPATRAIPDTDELPAGMSAFTYPPPQGSNTPYILLVHGWNMQAWDKDRFAETAFKRLYWQGYQGRFGDFHWPTYTGFNTYDESEQRAWQSGIGLSNTLCELNNEYPGNVYLMAHSMGNIVAGEALRQLGTNNIVNTYIAMQAAVPSHAYDTNAPTRLIPVGDWDGAPEVFANYYTNGAPCYFKNIAGAGTYVNFFNTNDFALNAWTIDQNQKPVTDGLIGYDYDPDTGDYSFNTTPLFFPGDTYTIFARIIQAQCYAVGAQLNVGGIFSTNNQVDLPSVWPPDPSGNNYGDHVWHSAEFRSDNPQRWLFWNTVLTRTKLNSNP